MWLAFVAHDISLFVRTALDLTIAYRQIRGQVSMLTPGRCNQQNLDSEKLYRTKNLDSSICYAKSLQSCPTLCDPIDGSPSSSPVPGILQARTLEWVAISFSNAWKWKWSRSVVSDSSRPRGLQPTRLLCPWDFPGKSTGVGCHFLFQCMKVKREREVAQSCPTLSDPIDCSLPGSSIHGIFQARVLEWGAIAFSKSRSVVSNCLQPRGLYRPEYWSG